MGLTSTATGSGLHFRKAPSGDRSGKASGEAAEGAVGHGKDRTDRRDSGGKAAGMRLRTCWDERERGAWVAGVRVSLHVDLLYFTSSNCGLLCRRSLGVIQNSFRALSSAFW